MNIIYHASHYRLKRIHALGMKLKIDSCSINQFPLFMWPYLNEIRHFYSDELHFLWNCPKVNATVDWSKMILVMAVRYQAITWTNLTKFYDAICWTPMISLKDFRSIMTQCYFCRMEWPDKINMKCPGCQMLKHTMMFSRTYVTSSWYIAVVENNYTPDAPFIIVKPLV